MQHLKRYVLAVFGALAAIALGLLAVFTGIKRQSQQKKIAATAVDLARENAARARAQADAKREAVDAKAKSEITAANDAALKEAADVANSVSLADFLNRKQ